MCHPLPLPHTHTKKKKNPLSIKLLPIRLFLEYRAATNLFPGSWNVTVLGLSQDHMPDLASFLGWDFKVLV